jgi:hypothetical protein
MDHVLAKMKNITNQKAKKQQQLAESKSIA